MGVGEGLGEAEVVVMKGVGVGAAMSVVPIRSASRVVSRPVAESVRLEVGIVKGFGLGKIVGVNCQGLIKNPLRGGDFVFLLPYTFSIPHQRGETCHSSEDYISFRMC